MIEAIIVCFTMGGGVEQCDIFQYKEPMERTEENLAEMRANCLLVVDGMAEEGFEVTCEEYVQE